ncbi:MAG: hypothetical protein V4561_03185 [Bacteroidota bacterium]
MKRQNPLMLSIPKPCNENWAEMSVVDKGRFCRHCQKTVIDVSNLDDDELMQFLSAQKESICLRALKIQTNRPFNQPVSIPNKFAYTAATIGFSLLLLAGGNSFARAPFRPEIVLASEDKRDPFMQAHDSVLLQGYVVDSSRKAIPNVVIKIISDSSQYSVVSSDTEGCFKVWVSKKMIEEERLLLETEHLAYQKLRLRLKKDLTEQSNSLLLNLQPSITPYQITNINTIQTHIMGAFYNPQPILPIKFRVIPAYNSKKYKILKKKK